MSKNNDEYDVHEIVVHAHFYFRTKEEAFAFIASRFVTNDFSYSSFKTSDDVIFYPDLVEKDDAKIFYGDVKDEE